ncbi:MAG TPA: tRNA (adenosine(37)-N6)-threonylcarbamoyltransferase complex dimerization subunit type 1 TsaB [Thermomicrobiales bacterium]|nr:tRNA (adenosine(37)-N6)-threonylcarbamoyltransferase complex dimerization subunit type 1 TsaB [Thermomicrobiales bacterium]
MAAVSDKTPSGWILAIDSSTAAAGVALTDGVRWAELNWTAGRDQTVTLLDQIDRMLGLMGQTTGDLAAIAIATGPGMFSGLRVGMGVAKGLVLGADIPLIGVSTLEATALPFAVTPAPVAATVSAGRGRLVWAIYRADETGHLSTLSPPQNGTPETLVAELARYPDGVIVCGELTPAQADAMRVVPAVSLPVEGVRTRRALAVAEIALRRLERGETDDAVALEPVYLHARSGA